jgi:hypothetical protein
MRNMPHSPPPRRERSGVRGSPNASTLESPPTRPVTIYATGPLRGVGCTRSTPSRRKLAWVPAFAGMTSVMWMPSASSQHHPNAGRDPRQHPRTPQRQDPRAAAQLGAGSPRGASPTWQISQRAHKEGGAASWRDATETLKLLMIRRMHLPCPPLDGEGRASCRRLEAQGGVRSLEQRSISSRPVRIPNPSQQGGRGVTSCRARGGGACLQVGGAR